MSGGTLQLELEAKSGTPPRGCTPGAVVEVPGAKFSADSYAFDHNGKHIVLTLMSSSGWSGLGDAPARVIISLGLP